PAVAPVVLEAELRRVVREARREVVHPKNREGGEERAGHEPCLRRWNQCCRYRPSLWRRWLRASTKSTAPAHAAPPRRRARRGPMPAAYPTVSITGAWSLVPTSA